APAQVDQPRRPVARPAHSVDHWEIVGEKARALRHLDAAAMDIGKLAGGGLKLTGAEIVGRRGDQIAAEIEGLGESKDLPSVDALRQHQPLGLWSVVGLVAGEAVVAGKERKRRKLGIWKRRGKAIIARGERRWQKPRRPRGLRPPTVG